MKFKTVFTFLALILLILPSVLADIRPPYPEETAVTWIVLLIINYIINFILIGIQSKIWLHLGFKKIAIGLAIITPIMFVIEAMFIRFLEKYLSFFNNQSLLVNTIPWIFLFLLIFLNYLFLAHYFWKINRKQALTTSIIMAILTNPGIIFAMLILGEIIFGILGY